MAKKQIKDNQVKTFTDEEFAQLIGKKPVSFTETFFIWVGRIIGYAGVIGIVTLGFLGILALIKLCVTYLI